MDAYLQHDTNSERPSPEETRIRLPTGRVKFTRENHHHEYISHVVDYIAKVKERDEKGDALEAKHANHGK